MEEEVIDYPFIVFKIKNDLFCVNSKHVATILQLPEYNQLPEGPSYITGIFPYRGDFIQMLDFRSFLGFSSLNEEYLTFAQMLDDRKQDHIHWVNELEQSIETGTKFSLATDPHKCALGKWYYSFQSDISTINFHLKKIEDPHYHLHQAALEVTKCTQDCDHCSRSECLKSILTRVKNNYVPTILNLLEETKETFKSTIYREVVLVLSDKSNIGLVVDEVLGVEMLEVTGALPQFKDSKKPKCIRSIRKSPKIPGEILELNIPIVLNEVAAASGIA